MQPVYVYDPYNLGSNIPMTPVAQPQIQGMVGISPGQIVVQGGIQMAVVQDPLSELESCTGVTIRQQPEFLEAIFGCETANRYHVYGQTPQGLKYLFKCQEKSGWCMRCCCPSNIREFNMEIQHVINATGQNLTKKFAEAYKPFKCPFLCCNRPEIFVNVGEQNNNLIGRIRHIFTCCDPEFEVYESNGNLKYYVHADCCQCGLLCANNICGKFSTALFNVYTPGTNNIASSISKMSAQSYGELVTDADSYTVGFPRNATVNDKLLLIALGLMIDYQYFETNSNDEGRGGYGYRRRYGYY